LNMCNINNHTINENKTVSVNGDLILIDIEESTIPIKFWEVKGDVICRNNKFLKNLLFAPYKCENFVILDCPMVHSLKGLSYPKYYNKIICEWDMLIQRDTDRTIKYWEYYTNKYSTYYTDEYEYIRTLINIVKKNQIIYTSIKN